MTNAWVAPILFGFAFLTVVLLVPLVRALLERVGDAIVAHRRARDTGERLPWRHER
jgi:hypothetical protein